MLADIPGLIEGAHEGAASATGSLATSSAAAVLLHLIDGTGEHAGEAYKTVRAELEAYGGGLADKPEIVALNKSDAMTPEDLKQQSARLKRALQADAADRLRRYRRRGAGGIAGADAKWWARRGRPRSPRRPRPRDGSRSHVGMTDADPDSTSRQICARQRSGRAVRGGALGQCPRTSRTGRRFPPHRRQGRLVVADRFRRRRA